MITQIEKQITQIHLGYGKGKGNDARFGNGNGDVTVTLTDTGFVALAVTLANTNLCNPCLPAGRVFKICAILFDF